MKREKILIVDDEVVICQSCEKVFSRRGYPVKHTTSGREALKVLEREHFDIVFTDLKMMDLGGMEVLKTVKENYPDVVVVIITGYATIASAVETMKLGAFDYLPKPFTSQELLSVLERAIERRKLTLASKGALAEEEAPTFPGIIGKSPKMQDVFRLITKVAPTDSTVLIMGESGTGKELVAKAIRENSLRRAGPFVAVDSGALSSQLLASELFGHVKGAFTGAVSHKRGLFEAADGGTLFLDEIANVDKDIQSKLLRVLQEKAFLPVGGTELKKVDVRLIFATNRDLKRMVSDNLFREDLYYRLHVFPILVPPLRERRGDIVELAYSFLKKFSGKGRKGVEKISEGVLETLMNYDWPGNVRQLENAIERMVIIADGDTLEMRHLPVAIFREGYEPEREVPETADGLKEAKKDARRQTVESIEKTFLIRALERSGWNVTAAAREVGMARPNFQALLRKYHLRARERGGQN